MITHGLSCQVCPMRQGHDTWPEASTLSAAKMYANVGKTKEPARPRVTCRQDAGANGPLTPLNHILKAKHNTVVGGNASAIYTASIRTRTYQDSGPPVTVCLTDFGAVSRPVIGVVAAPLLLAPPEPLDTGRVPRPPLDVRAPDLRHVHTRRLPRLPTNPDTKRMFGSQ
jgi:hypothetical protein